MLSSSYIETSTPPNASEIIDSEVYEESSREKIAIAGQYILGKVAGEDLYDSSGKMIAQKGDELTEEIIVAADRSGKLSELIINMTIPDLPVLVRN
jgi:hypothetical protein